MLLSYYNQKWLIQAYNDPMNKVVKSAIYDVYEKRV